MSVIVLLLLFCLFVLSVCFVCCFVCFVCCFVCFVCLFCLFVLSVCFVGFVCLFYLFVLSVCFVCLLLSVCFAKISNYFTKNTKWNKNMMQLQDYPMIEIAIFVVTNFFYSESDVEVTFFVKIYILIHKEIYSSLFCLYIHQKCWIFIWFISVNTNYNFGKYTKD